MSDFKRDFIYTIPESILFDGSLNFTDTKIYMIVRSFMDTTGDAYPTNGWIATKIEIDPLTVSRSISKLVKKKYLERIEDDKGHRHLRVLIKSVPEDLVSNLGVDLNVKGGRRKDQGGVDLNVNQLDQRDIISKNINIAFLKTKNELEDKPNKISNAEIQLIFNKIWEMYPLKKAKQKALEWFNGALGGKTPEKAEKFAMEIYEGLNACINEHLTKIQLKNQGADLWVPNLPYLITWLRGSRWLDKYESPDDILRNARRKSGTLDATTLFN